MTRRTATRIFATLSIASTLLGVGVVDASAARTLASLSLRSVDARCFYVDFPGATSWPVKPFGSPSAVRGSFNEPRGPVHHGVDIETPDVAAVYSIADGTVTGARPAKVRVKTGGTTLSYWHVSPAPGVRNGMRVKRGQLIGHVLKGFWHVHVTEYVKGCGIIDPRRPGGPLYDSLNTRAPRIGGLSAYVASGAFTTPSTLKRDGYSDPARPVALLSLSGVVDLRAEVDVMPRRIMKTFEQLPGAPSIVRGWLAPASSPSQALSRVFLWSGARLQSQSGLWRIWAPGTYRSNQCYYSRNGECGFRLVFHVGGGNGLDTRDYPNGRYQYCIEATSINDRSARRCTAVTIAN